ITTMSAYHTMVTLEQDRAIKISEDKMASRDKCRTPRLGCSRCAALPLVTQLLIKP
ncbi:hypothetical protein GOODEAATRI_007433, partial [Goodea atripinnis]